MQTVQRLIFVLGPPGAGKSYLCERAAREIRGVQHVPMSAVLRWEAARPLSPWAKEIKSKLATGALVNGQTAAFILRSFLDPLPFGKSRILLDGFPRNLDQARESEKQVGIARAAIELTGKREITEKKIAGRRGADDGMAIAARGDQDGVNETGPTIYHLKNILPKVHQVPSETDEDEEFEIFKKALSGLLQS